MKIKNIKTGEWVTWKEFFRQWKKGMQEVTPLQQKQIIQFGQIITLIGIIWGMIFSFRIGYWWMGVILIGGLIVLGVQILGNWQMKVMLKEMDKQIKIAEAFEKEEEHGNK